MNSQGSHSRYTIYISHTCMTGYIVTISAPMLKYMYLLIMPLPRSEQKHYALRLSGRPSSRLSVWFFLSSQ